MSSKKGLFASAKFLCSLVGVQIFIGRLQLWRDLKALRPAGADSWALWEVPMNFITTKQTWQTAEFVSQFNEPVGKMTSILTEPHVTVAGMQHRQFPRNPPSQQSIT